MWMVTGALEELDDELPDAAELLEDGFDELQALKDPNAISAARDSATTRFFTWIPPFPFSHSGFRAASRRECFRASWNAAGPGTKNYLYCR